MPTPAQMIEAMRLSTFSGSGDRTEALTYTPNGGAAVAINAIVVRRTAAPYKHTSAPVIEVTVLNDATYGISSATLDRGADLITVAERYGDTATARNIVRIIRESAVTLTLELR